MNDYNFDVAVVKHGCIKWIQDWFEKNAPKDSKAIIGISGGKDSSVVAALCVAALGKERVIGVLMPYISGFMRNDANDAIGELLNHKKSLGLKKNGQELFATIDKHNSSIQALNDGYKLCAYLGIEHIVVNIYDAVQAISRSVDDRYPLTNQAKINLQPRVRMATLYTVSQSVNGRVANTSNLSEIYLGYGTRWGDTVGDFAPLANLTCTEVRKLGQSLGLPKFFVNRTPDDGLCGHSDEDSFGFTYAELDQYIRYGVNGDSDLLEDTVQLINDRHHISEFKRQPIASFPLN